MILLPDPLPEDDESAADSLPESSAAFDPDSPDTMPSPAEMAAMETGPVFLLDKYRNALVGITVTSLGIPRPIYSVNRLKFLLESMDKMKGEAARDKLLDLIRGLEERYGERSPVFMDDIVAEKPRIISPHNPN